MDCLEFKDHKDFKVERAALAQPAQMVLTEQPGEQVAQELQELLVRRVHQVTKGRLDCKDQLGLREEPEASDQQVALVTEDNQD